MILQPQESSIVKLCLKDTRENISEIFFQPTISSHDIEIHPALHTVKNSCFPTVIRNLGKENTLADFLSRFPVNRTEISNTPQDEQELILPVVETYCNTINATSDTSLEISTSTWLKEQADDTQTNEIIQLLKNPSLKDSNNIRGFYIDPTTHILMFKSHRKSQAELIVVPKSLQHKALDICHISHTGLDKTYQIDSNKCYWKGVYIDTKNLVLSCEQCIKNKSFTPKHAPPQSNRMPTRTVDYISVDIKGPLPNSGYVLTVLDHFSKHIVL
ncbi:hypothetical protein AVEN_33325-1 [Araneus ventricosus]|uniref:RNA-directed DNA polymerase n=1 Tax=Araneus ventricosus TaxID=182803 RepID=A0A4Y2QH13_ARAVE|nr:hypothetical protein AVEN_33325-1 [Araneus ventricosus]